MFITSHMIEYKPYAKHHYYKNLPGPITADECKEHCVEEYLATEETTQIPFDCHMPNYLNPRPGLKGLSPEEVDAIVTGSGEPDCIRQNPRCFVVMLRQFYPELYHQLREATRTRMVQKLGETYLHSTYQIDFDHAVEYPEPIDCTKLLPRLPQLPLKYLLDMGQCSLVKAMTPCDTFRMRVMNELVKEDNKLLYKLPEKSWFGRSSTFGDGSEFVGAGSSRWVPRDRIDPRKYTEYMDTINRVGCMVMKNDLHIHTDCDGGRRCKHHLVHKCKFLH